MIPSNNAILSTEIEIERQPSKNYKMNLDLEKKVITGYCDEQEAILQVIYKILNTERYDYIIYSCDYGIELKDLFGEPLSYVCPELQDRITEALLQDDRIIEISNFDFSFPDKGEILVTFIAETIFGDVKVERKVNV